MNYPRINLLILFIGAFSMLLCLSYIGNAEASSNNPGESEPILNQPSLIAANCSSVTNGTCVQTRNGLSLCRLNNVCVVKVDLSTNTLRPQVSIAADGGTQYVSTMAVNSGALAAINGDYFSGCPDPNSPQNCGQGITYINGVDFTRYEFDNWQNRRSLGFNDSFDPNMGMWGEQERISQDASGGWSKGYLGWGVPLAMLVQWIQYRR